MSGRVEPYYPGCSGKTTERAYVRTSIYVMRKLGVEVKLLDDLPCCGTLEGELADRELVRRVAGIIKREAGGRIITGCSGCYSTINRNGGSATHILEFLAKEVGLDEISSRVERKVNLRVAPYYGCLALRPRSLAIDDPEDPRILEDIISLTGAKFVDFPMKTKCCGGPLALREPSIAVRMAQEVIDSAKGRGAESIITMCNLCHFMLDFYASGLPVLHFTQLLAYSMGMPEEELGFEDLFNPPPRDVFRR